MNRLEISGRLTRDPDVKQGPKTKIAQMGVAVSVVDGPDVSSLFLDFKAFSPIADIIETLRKGDQVYIVATGKTAKWEGRDGKSHSSTEWWIQFIQPYPRPRSGAPEPKKLTEEEATDDVPF